MTEAIFKISENKSLVLRYSARRAEKLEAELGCSLTEGLTKVDRIGVLSKYISCGADITHDEALDAYDEYIGNGGTLESAVDVIFAALENGGFIAKGAAETAKKIRDRLRARVS